MNPKRMITISMGAAGVVALAAILDLALAIPFGGSMVFDILFILAAAIVGYMAYDTFHELA
jgi:hypothetical protein